MKVEVLTDPIARLAGAAVGTTAGAGTIDAILLTTAAFCSDAVLYTSDPDDLSRLRDAVPRFGRLKIRST